ncbi:MAG: 5-formyltetrahydrofolate cyclo-ligase, partial [Actinomycetota bacterium]|nr:5-formyltetrahydrofolate cyclo-ligase [Actinomycetota bacterium]
SRMNSGWLKRAKRRIRRRVLEERDAVPTTLRQELGERMAERFLSLPEVHGARTIMLFWSFGSEVPTGPLIDRLHERGVAVAVPRIEDGDLVPIRYVPGDPTTSTSFGAEEPVGEMRLDLSSIDVVAVPGVAFDRRGRRIGYGGGYYDRFLLGLSAFTVALGFGLQVLDEDLPGGSFDLPVDAIVTEDETIRPST